MTRTAATLEAMAQALAPRSRTLALTAAMLMASPSVRADAIENRVDAIVRSAMRTQQIPGVCLGVVRDGRLVKATGYGYANVELRVPMSASSVFQSGSVAKQFTATVIMMLVNGGKLGLDDPLSKYYPEARSLAAGVVTVRQLLTHTSGIPDIFGETDETSYAKGILDFRHDYTEEELLHKYLALPLDFKPGDRWSYSNTGYEILGFLIHRITGEFYGDVLRQRIFGPLSMTATRIISEEDIIPNRVSGYRIIDGQLKNQEWIAPSLNTTADGGLYTTVTDLAKWDAALYTEELLPRSALGLMWTPVRLNSGLTHGYGFGWELASANGHPWIYHTGSNQGFYIGISRYPKDRLTVIVLTNLDESHSSALQIAVPVAAIYLPSLNAPTRPLPQR
jgi:CubicO group peptidase (beta-lactamase class C family)